MIGAPVEVSFDSRFEQLDHRPPDRTRPALWHEPGGAHASC